MFRRIRNHAHAYAPIGLPAVYDIVKADGEIVTPDQFGFETIDAAKTRADAQEHVWNEIWKRRVVYFATVGATAWLLAFPLISGATRSDEFTSPIRWVSDIIRFVGAFLPGFASTWVDGYARAPFSFLLLAGLVAFFNLWGMRIASRIDDRMGAIWRKTSSAPSGLPDDFVYRLRSNQFYIALHEGMKRRWAPAFFALLFVYIGLALVNRLLYNAQDVAGLTCTPSTETKGSRQGARLRHPSYSRRRICASRRAFISMAAERRYSVKVEPVPSDTWYDAGIKVPFGGFSPADQPTWNRAESCSGSECRCAAN